METIKIDRIVQILKNAQEEDKMNELITKLERINKSHPHYGKSATFKAAAKELGL